MTLGQKLVALRKAKKLSQKAAADALGVSARTYLRWEKDESKLSKDTVKKISDFYGEELSAYVDGKNVEKPDSAKVKVSDKPVKSKKATKVMPKAAPVVSVTASQASSVVAAVVFPPRPRVTSRPRLPAISTWVPVADPVPLRTS